jgi:DNA-binding HxlR family transcriptional regulator
MMAAWPALMILKNRWDLQLIAQSLRGVRRFDDFHGRLGISHKVLAERLKELVAEGFLERRKYQSRPDRYEYTLTERSRDLLPVVEALAAWSVRWSPSCEDR